MRFLSGGNDLSICHGTKLWDIKGFLMHKDPILSLAFFYDSNLKNKLVFSSSSDASVKVWNIRSPENNMKEIKEHKC